MPTQLPSDGWGALAFGLTLIAVIVLEWLRRDAKRANNQQTPPPPPEPPTSPPPATIDGSETRAIIARLNQLLDLALDHLTRAIAAESATTTELMACREKCARLEAQLTTTPTRPGGES